ncbi:hypothetical protein MCOR25_000787 [Pyricularia grisea]|uniref:UBC core domain-containing protein n=1 Tax=Pyricularia grisea TaxID=148305 RepID=A0A6P8BDJ6_PYRGI|nr:uncharacterized protein PgNI_02790 [Pyricularia grisea]KAI6382196.1 hypothetical protein MCOR25_000787 [Pyricularia grisea]TLD13829.1 hypothetical protein PgNI_02790 [Pyricularia grisea]
MASSRSTAPGAAGAKQRLASEFASLLKEPWVHFNDPDMIAANLFHWRFGLVVTNPDSDFYEGYFKVDMAFPTDYPYSPPQFKFATSTGIFHPNVYPDGRTCISILHRPGEDLMSGEMASERWSPLQGVESVLRSVLLLLDDPEIGSPANVDASVTYRDDRARYKQRAREAVARSHKDKPEDFVMPESLEVTKPPPKADYDEDFFQPSDEGEFDFGGSDTDDEGDMEFEDEDEDDEDVKMDTEEKAERRQKKAEDSDDGVL